MQEKIDIGEIPNASVVEVPEFSLTEIDEELKQNNVLQREYNQILIELTQQVSSLQLKVDRSNVNSSTVDTTAIKSILDQRHQQFGNLLESYIRRHSFRILLFPEYDAEGYYKMVFGRLLGWLVLIVAIFVVYRLGMNWLSTDYGETKYKHAWEQMYGVQNKTEQKEMNRILDQQ